jgi:hypothetical protein
VGGAVARDAQEIFVFFGVLAVVADVKDESVIAVGKVRVFQRFSSEARGDFRNLLLRNEM